MKSVLRLIKFVVMLQGTINTHDLETQINFIDFLRTPNFIWRSRCRQFSFVYLLIPSSNSKRIEHPRYLFCADTLCSDRRMQYGADKDSISHALLI